VGYVTSEVVLRYGTYYSATCICVIDMKASLIRCGKKALSAYLLLNRYCFKRDGRSNHMYTLIDLCFKILIFGATGRSLVQRNLQIVDVGVIECDHVNCT